MTFSPIAIFQRDEKYEGVRRINIYLLRLVYILMFFLLGKDTWTHVLTHRGPWEPVNAVAWCVWTAFATLAGLGIIRPLKMLPILLLEIFYKVLWLILVAYPLWSTGKLAGSPAEGITSGFIWGDTPHHRCALGIRVCELFLLAKEVEYVRPRFDRFFHPPVRSKLGLLALSL